MAGTCRLHRHRVETDEVRGQRARPLVGYVQCQQYGKEHVWPIGRQLWRAQRWARREQAVLWCDRPASLRRSEQERPTDHGAGGWQRRASLWDEANGAEEQRQRHGRLRQPRRGSEVRPDLSAQMTPPLVSKGDQRGRRPSGSHGDGARGRRGKAGNVVYYLPVGLYSTRPDTQNAAWLFRSRQTKTVSCLL